MKKITLKIIAFLFLTMFAVQLNAQTASKWSNTPGIYKIKLVGKDLYVTVNTSNGVLTVEDGLPGDDDKQLFEINNHPSEANFFIKSVISSQGVVEAVDTGDATPNLECKGNNAMASGQQDQWNLGRNDGTTMYLWSDKTDTGWSGVSARRRVASLSSAGSVLKCSGSNDAAFEYVLVNTLSTEKFGIEAFSISNPINNTLTIKGATSKVSKVNVYSVLGNTVLSKSMNNISGDISLNTSSLSTGLYIIEMTGNNGERFTKKIIKQ